MTTSDAEGVAPYSGPLTFVVTVRPARVGYLIAAGSRTGFRRAIQEATTRWNGVTEPVVPVHRDGRLPAPWRQVVEVANLDSLVNVDLPEQTAKSAAEALALEFVPIAHVDRAGPGRFTTHAALVAQHTSLAVIAERGADLRLAIVAGDISDQHEAELPEGFGWIRREPHQDMVCRADLTADTALARGLVPRRAHNIHREFFGQAPAIIWLAPPRSFKDCLWFWNFRALRADPEDCPMYLVPAEQHQGWLNYHDRLTHAVRRPENVQPDIVVASLSIPEADLQEFGRSLGLTYQRGTLKTGIHTRLKDRPSTFTTSNHIDPRHWLLSQQRYGDLAAAEAHIHRGAGTVRFSSPIRWTQDLAGRALLAFRSPQISQFPCRQRIAESILPNGSWNDDGIEFGTTALSSYEFPITMPTLGDATWMTVREVSPGARLSDKGQLATALVDSAEAMLSPGMYEAAVALATPRRHALLNELRQQSNDGTEPDQLEELAARWGGNAQRAYLHGGQVCQRKGLAAQAALEGLCAIGWAERGLEVRCTRCTLRSFVPLAGTTDRAQCPACNAEQPYTHRKRDPSPEVFYRLGSLQDRATDQGVLPHLLVTAALHRTGDGTHILPGLLLPETPVELDIYGIHNAQVIAGEIKSNAAQFDRRQLAEDIHSSQAARADVHLIASVDLMPEDMTAQVRKLTTKAGMGVLILDRHLLRPTNPNG